MSKAETLRDLCAAGEAMRALADGVATARSLNLDDSDEFLRWRKMHQRFVGLVEAEFKKEDAWEEGLARVLTRYCRPLLAVYDAAKVVLEQSGKPPATNCHCHICLLRQAIERFDA